MNKQAILIMAHNNYWTLTQLIKSIDSNYFDIYLHVDLKSSIKINKIEIKKMVKKSKIYLYQKFDVRWADFSQVECELFLMKQAKSHENYLYYHLLSGVDMPLKSPSYIYNFFINNAGKEFIHFVSNTFPKKKKNYYTKYQKNMKNYRKSNVEKIKNKISLFIQNIFLVDRQKKSSTIFMTGANWFSITDSLVQYVLDNEKWIYDNFYETRSSDEIFLQTLVYNSKFRDNLYNNEFNNNYISCVRLIDWNRGDPYIFKENDYEELINSKCMFARKFDEKIDKIIIKKLRDYTQNKGVDNEKK